MEESDQIGPQSSPSSVILFTISSSLNTEVSATIGSNNNNNTLYLPPLYPCICFTCKYTTSYIYSSYPAKTTMVSNNQMVKFNYKAAT